MIKDQGVDIFLFNILDEGVYFEVIPLALEGRIIEINNFFIGEECMIDTVDNALCIDILGMAKDNGFFTME